MQRHAARVAARMDEDYHMSCSLLPHPGRSTELTQYLAAVQDTPPDREALVYSLRKELNDMTALLRVAHRLCVFRGEQVQGGDRAAATAASQFAHVSYSSLRTRLDAVTAWMLEHADMFKKTTKDGREDPEVRISHQLGVRRWPGTSSSTTTGGGAAPNSKGATHSSDGSDGLLGTQGRSDRFLALAPVLDGGSVRFGLWLALKDRNRSLEVNHHAVGIKLKIPKAVTTMGVAVRAVHTDFDAAAATAEAAAEFEAALAASALAAERPASSMRPRSQGARPHSSVSAGSAGRAGGSPGDAPPPPQEDLESKQEPEAASSLDSLAHTAAQSLSVASVDAQHAAAAVSAALAAKPAERSGSRSGSRSRSRSKKKKKAAAEPEPTMEEKMTAAAQKHAAAYIKFKRAVAQAHDFTGGATLPELPSLPQVEDKNLWTPVGGVVAVELLERPSPGKFIRKWMLTPASALHSTVRRCPHPHEGKGETAQVHALRLQITLRPSVLPPPELYVAYWDAEVMVPEAGGGYLKGIKGGFEEAGAPGSVPGVHLPPLSAPSVASLLPPASGWVVDEDAAPEIEDGVLSFSTTWMKQQALVQPRYLDMPYRAWSVGPGPRASAASVHSPVSLLFSVTTQRLQLAVEVRESSVALASNSSEDLPQQLAPLRGEAGHALHMGPGQFLLALRDCGVNLLADEECAAVLRGDFPGPKQNPPALKKCPLTGTMASMPADGTTRSLGETNPPPAASGAGGDDAVKEEHKESDSKEEHADAGESKEGEASVSLPAEGKYAESEGGGSAAEGGSEDEADDMVSSTEVVSFKDAAVESVAYRDICRIACAVQVASSVWANSPRAPEDVHDIPPPPHETSPMAQPTRAQPESLRYAQAERAGVAIIRARDATYAHLLPDAAGAEHGTSWRYLRYSFDSAAPENAVVQLLGGATEDKLPGLRSAGAAALQAEDALSTRLGPGTLQAIQEHSSILAERMLRLLRLVRPLSFAVTPCDAAV